MSVDAAIARLEALALACTSVDIKSAPLYPVDNAMPCPFVITHHGSGSGTPQNGTSVLFNPSINVDFMFSDANIGAAYHDMDAIALEFMQRLCGDPRLNNTVNTIVFPVTYEISPTEWNNVVLQMLRFIVPLKTLETPTTTA